MVLDINGAIGPAIADYAVRGLKAARQGEAGVVVLRMNTPGGLDSSMREIIAAILASPVPVVTYVAPNGARAASAGTYIAYASSIAAMAPGTNIGAATPIQLGGSSFFPGGSPQKRPALVPRCDDTILRARGDCIDNGAGLKLVPRDGPVPQNLAGPAGKTPQDPLVLRQKDTSVVSSPVPLAGPVVYEFRLAHR